MQQRMAVIVARYVELMSSAPEMTGISLAHDRGNISGEELDAFEKLSREIDAECQLLRGQLERCERDDGAAFRQCLEDACAAIDAREKGLLTEHQAWCLREARVCIDFRLGRRPGPARDMLWALSVARG